MLNRFLNPLSTSSQIITDGTFTCTFAEISQHFAKFEKSFAEAGISVGDRIAFECENSVPSALVLLYLLEAGYSFLLLPNRAKLGHDFSIPCFCRYRVNILSDGSLQIAPNETWNPTIAASDFSQGYLYVRTSGSTGKPKLVVHAHSALLNNAHNALHRLTIDKHDRVALPVPIYHLFGLGAGFLPSFFAGAAIDLQKEANLIKYLERERTFNPTIAFMIPSFCKTLLKGRRANRDYRFTVVAGDRLSEETFWQYETRFGRVVPLYGSTEMGVIAAASPTDSSQIRAKTVGSPLPAVQVRIKAAEGELWCQHAWGFTGYADLAGHPLEGASDWFQTKDWGQIGEQGTLEVLGRCDHSVNRDGLLVFFADIERAIADIPGIAEVAVVATGETARGKGLTACCAIASGYPLTEDDVRRACFELLPQRAVPDRVCILESLPLLPNGKLDRQALINL